MNNPVIRLVGRPVAEPEPGQEPLFHDVDVYDLEYLDWSGTRGVIITGDVDQLHLLGHRGLLNDFVRHGGRVLINGHVQRPFLESLGTWRRLDYRGPDDLALTRLVDHPVWRGVDLLRLQFTLGAGRAPEEGLADEAQLRSEGVAGFYGRGYLLPLPEGARVINGLGPLRAPIDVEYPLGNGHVLVHCGNDLEHFAAPERGSTHLAEQLHAWLAGRISPTDPAQEA
ncbi:hypothetical protein [Corynebacterium halotolerans]|uniref:Uncharacterized protein n=1 Tax=Corynebacterium halotolerans YIM 70093 = DSM 44683 TaxID=1121362 RepID=M1MX24_9CORY|nr:hypothetical protein [Corynebacterium halotolerans]AGF72309.1 hypothetical protein A605_06535 [Corynebacterium halotolerans YIM 70093 = DSM 44683]